MRGKDMSREDKIRTVRDLQLYTKVSFLQTFVLPPVFVVIVNIYEKKRSF